MSRASRFYGRILALYPKAHRDAFGKQMQSTFDDHYSASAGPNGRVPIVFWIAVLRDEGVSIARERSAALIGAALVAWGLVIVFLPPALPTAAWPLLLAPAAAGCAAFLAAPRLRGALPKAATVLVVAAVVVGQLVVGRNVNDIGDLALPALTLACVLFFVKAATGWSSPAARRIAVWSPAELAFGLVVGINGVVALALGSSTQVDYDSVTNAALFGLIPITSGVAGYVIGREQRDFVAAVCGAVGSFLLGTMMWIAARAVLVEMASPGNISGWRHVLAGVLLINGILAVSMAVLGQLTRQEAEVLSR